MGSLSIGFKVLIGISFVAVLADMLMIEGNFKKYVRSILGLIMLLVMIQAFTGFKNISFDMSFLNDAGAQESQEITVDLAKDVKQRIEIKIKDALEKNNITAKDIDVTIDKDYNLTSVVLSLDDRNNEKKAIQILETEWKIEKKLISFY